MVKIQIVETEGLPKCPYCGKELDKIEKISKEYWEGHFVYRCPYCHKLLSINKTE